MKQQATVSGVDYSTTLVVEPQAHAQTIEIDSHRRLVKFAREGDTVLRLANSGGESLDATIHVAPVAELTVSRATRNTMDRTDQVKDGAALETYSYDDICIYLAALDADGHDLRGMLDLATRQQLPEDQSSGAEIAPYQTYDADVPAVCFRIGDGGNGATERLVITERTSGAEVSFAFKVME